MKSILNEIAGLVVRSPSQQMGSTRNQIDSRILTDKMSDIMPLCSRMQSWQDAIFKSLRTRDQYIAASPGAGKTLPYVCYWLQNMIGLSGFSGTTRIDPKDYIRIANAIINEPDKLPKLVILVPIRSLAQQTIQEFRVIFSQIIASFLTNLLLGLVNQNQTPSDPNRPNTGGIMVGQIDKDAANLIASISTGLQTLMNQRSGLMFDFNQKQKEGRFEISQRVAEEIKTLDDRIRGGIIEAIKDIVEGGRSRYGLVALRTGLGPEGNPNYAPVVISIYESAPKIIDEIADRIRLLVCDESHLIQDKESLVRDSSRAYNIAGSLYKILGRLKNVNYRLLFLSGTANPSSAENLAKYINMCFGRNIQVVQPPSSATNRSSVAIVPDDSVNDDRKLIDIIKKSQGGNVIVVFSKRKINDLAQQAIKQINPRSLQQVQQGTYKSYQHKSILGDLPGYGGSPKRDIDIDPVKIGKTAATKGVMEASRIHDALLRQAVQCGFGYIYRLDERDREFDERKKDNEIVADLFSSGKIKTLLATDAVGVGVNIKVKNLIIPTIEKPTGGGMREPMDPATLAQLLHRAGRGAFMYATIVTPDKNIARVSHALSLSPEGFAAGTTIQNFPAGACRMSNFFADLWGAL